MEEIPSNNTTGTGIPNPTAQTKPDWITARLQGKIPSYTELFKVGMSPENFDFQDMDTYANAPAIQKIFAGQDGKLDKQAFKDFYDNEKKQFDSSRNTTLDLVNFQEGSFTSLGEKLKTGSPITGISQVKPDALGRGFVSDLYLKPQNSIREAANKRGVKLPDGSYMPVGEYEGLTRFAKNKDGSFRFDDKGLPYHEPVENENLLRSFDETYNWLSDVTGQYGFTYDAADYAMSIPRNLLNFLNSTMDGLAEFGKAPLAVAGGENTSLYSGLESAQNWLRRNKVSSAGEVNEGFFSFKNLNDLAQNVIAQLGSMYAVGSSLTKAGSAMGVRNPAQFGSVGARMYMTAIASAPLAQVARENGLKEREVALMLAATTPFIYKIAGLSESVIKGIDPVKFQAGLKDIFKNAAAEIGEKQASSGTLRALSTKIMSGAGSLMYGLSKTPVVRGAALEGLEETAEQAVDWGAREVWNKGFSREGARFDIDIINEAKLLGLSFAGGAIGGAIADPLLRKLSGNAPEIVTPLHEAVLDGKEDRLLGFLDKMEKENRLDASWLDINNKPTSQPENSRNKAVAEIYRGMINRLVELRDSYNLKETIPNNERRAQELKSALGFSDLGKEIRQIHSRVISLERDIAEKKMTDQELKIRKDELEHAKEQLAGIQSGEFVNDYIAQGVYNLLALKKSLNVPSVSGSQFVSLMNSLPVSHAIELERAKLINDQIAVTDTSATPDNYKGVSAKGKNRLLTELSPQLQQHGESLRAHESAIKAIAPGFSVDQLISTDHNEVYEAALSLEDAAQGGFTPSSPVQEQSGIVLNEQNVEDELAKAETRVPGEDLPSPAEEEAMTAATPAVDIKAIAALAKKYHEIASHKETVPYEAGDVEEQVLNMVDKVDGIFGEKLVSSHIPIEEKLHNEQQLEKDMTKNNVSLYNNLSEIQNVVSSIARRKAQLLGAMQVMPVVNPLRTKSDLQPLPDFIGRDEKLLKRLNDMEKEAMRLYVTAAQNSQNAEALAELATVKSLEKRLNTMEDIVEVLTGYGASDLAQVMAEGMTPLYSAIEKHDSIGFLKQLVSLESDIYNRFGDKEADILKAFPRPEGSIYDNITRQMTDEALNTTRMYDYMRGILRVQSSELWNAFNLALKTSAEKSLVPTIEQQVIAIDSVRNALAGLYQHPVYDASMGANVHSFSAAIDGGPGTGKSSVVIPLVTGIMQKMRPGKTLVTAFKDARDSKRIRVNGTVRDFYKGDKVINIKLKDFSGSLLDFVRDASANKDTTSVVFDEATLLTTDELRSIASELEKLNQIRVKSGTSPLYIFYTFDSAQNSYKHKYSDADKDRVIGIAHNSTQVIPRTERMTYSHRSMNHSLKVLEDYLYHAQQFSGNGRSVVLAHKAGIGVNVINSEDRFFNELRSLIAENKSSLSKLAVITDMEPIQLPSDIITSGVQILSPELAQGDEWDNVALILKDKNIFDENSINAYTKRAYYTGVTRAKNYLIVNLPVDSTIASAEGNPAVISPINPEGKRDEKFTEVRNILGEAISQEVTPAKYVVVEGDDLFNSTAQENPLTNTEAPDAKRIDVLPTNKMEGKNTEVTSTESEDTEPVTEEPQQTQPKAPETVHPVDTVDQAKEIAKFFRMVNTKPVTMLYTFFTDAQGNLQHVIEAKRKLLFDPLARKNASFHIAIAPIGSPEYSNAILNNPAYTGELATFLEAEYQADRVLLGVFPDPGKKFSTLVAQSGIMKSRQSIRIPVSENIVNEMISRFPEKIKDSNAITPLDRFLKDRTAEGVSTSSAFIVTENQNINGMDYQSGDTYVASSLYYSKQELDARIARGEDVLSDPYITTLKLTPRSVSRDEAINMLTKYVTKGDSGRAELPSTGDVGKMYSALWRNKFRSNARREQYRREAKSFYEKSSETIKNLMDKRGYLDSPDFILSNYIERKATGNIDLVPAFEQMFKEIPLLADALKNMRIESVKQRNSAKGTLALVDNFENEPLNNVRYSVHGVRELTYPIIGINTAALQSELGKAVSQPSIASTTKSVSSQKQGETRENSPALVSSKQLEQEFTQLETANASITEIFQTLFAGPRHIWFIPMVNRFRREVWNNLFVLTGDVPLMRDINTAMSEMQKSFAARVAAYPLPEEITTEHRDVYIDNVIYNHFGNLLNHYYPVVKFSDEFNQYYYESRHVKDSGFYDRDQFSQIEDGMTEMVKSHLYNTPILEEGAPGKLLSTGRYLNESSIEELVDYTRGLRTLGEISERFSRDTNPLIRSLYVRFFSPTPNIVDGVKTHSLSSLLDNEDVFHMLNTIVSSLTSSEVFPISFIDISEGKMNIPTSIFKPTHSAQVGLEGIISVSENGNIEKTSTGFSVNGSHFPINKVYSDDEVVQAMRSLGLGYFSPETLTELENSVEVLKRNRGAKRVATNKWIMERVFFPVVSKVQVKTDQPSAFYSDALDKVFKAIKKNVGVKENLYDINLDGERSPRVRRTAPIFTINSRIAEVKSTSSLSQDNLFVKDSPTYEITDSGFFVKQGVKSTNRLGFQRTKSNSRLTQHELLETDLIWGFANTVDKYENVAALPIMVYSDSSTEVVPLIKSNKDWFRSPRSIVQEIFNSRSSYYSKLEKELLQLWSPFVQARTAKELSLILKTSRIPVQQIESSPMVKNLFYIADKDKNAVLKQRLVDEIEFYKTTSNVNTLADRMHSRYKELLAYTKETKDNVNIFSRLDNRKHSAENYVSAFYYNWAATSGELSSLLGGSQFQYNGDSNTREYINTVKRGKLKISNRSAQVLRDTNWEADYVKFKAENPNQPLPAHLMYEGLKLNRFAKVAFVKDIEKQLTNYSNALPTGQKVYDGASFVTPLTRVFQFYSNGGPHGVFMGPAAKNITSEYNYSTSSNIEVKNAEFEITPEMMMNGSEFLLSVVRKSLAIPFNNDKLEVASALEALHKIVGVPEDFSQVSRKDFETLAKWLVENNVQDSPILEIIPDTSAKTGMHSINELTEDVFTPTVLDQYSKGAQLDATKDPFEGLNTKVLTQMVNALAINWANDGDLKAFYGSLASIAASTATKAEQTPLEDTENILRAVLRDSILSREMMTLASELVRHPTFSLQDRHVMNSFISNLNARLSDEGIAFKFGGGQYILYPSDGLVPVYDVVEDGQIKTMLRSQLNGRKPVDEGGRNLRWMDPVRADGKTLSTLYKENTPLEQIKSSLQTDKWTRGFCELILPGEMRDSFMLQDAFDANLAIDDINIDYFKQQLTKLSEQDPRRKKRDSDRMAELMFKEFRARLEGSMSRIPTTGKHSGVTTKIVGFVNDTMNGVFVPAELLMVQGADQDIDKGSYVTKKDIRKAFQEKGLLQGREKAIAQIGFLSPIANDDFTLPPEYDDLLRGFSKQEKALVQELAIQNRISQKLSDILSDPKNLIELNTTVGDALQELRELRDTIIEQSEKEEPLAADNYLSYAKMHEQSQAGGKNLIAIFANGQKAYQVLYTAARMTGRKTNLPEGVYDTENKIWLRYASFINAATDNGNEQILGPMGIDENNASFVNYFISRGWDAKQIYEFLKEHQDFFDVIREARRFDSTRSFRVDKARLWKSDSKMSNLYYRVQEFNTLSQVLLNREIPNSAFESFNYQNNLEKFVNDSYKYHDSITNNKNKKLDFSLMRFIADDLYAQTQIEQYEQMIEFDGTSYTGRHAYNVLDVLKSVPHIAAYQKVFAASRKVMQQYPIIRVTDEVAAQARTAETIRSISEDMYRSINDFVYGLTIDNYFKSREKVVGDYDLSTPVGRAGFVNLAHSQLFNMKDKFKGNRFIEQLVLSEEQRGKEQYQRLRLFDAQNLTEEAILELKAAFTLLPEKNRQNFFYYSLIADRDLPSKGSISAFIDLADKIDYNQFLQKEMKYEDIAVTGTDFVRHRERQQVSTGRFRNYRLQPNSIPFEIVNELTAEDVEMQMAESGIKNPLIAPEHISLIQEVVNKFANMDSLDILLHQEGRVPRQKSIPKQVGYFSVEQSSEMTINEMVESVIENPGLYSAEQVAQLSQLNEHYKRAAEQLTDEDTVKRGKACGLFAIK